MGVLSPLYNWELPYYNTDKIDNLSYCLSSHGIDDNNSTKVVVDDHDSAEQTAIMTMMLKEYIILHMHSLEILFNYLILDFNGRINLVA